MRLLLLAIPLLLFALFAAFGPLFFYWNGWRNRRARRKELQRLTRVPTAELVASARNMIKFEHWEHFGPAAELLQKAQWTDEELRANLDALYAAVVEEDRAQGRSGRDSNSFEFHDCGLAGICEALQARAMRPTEREGSSHH